MLALMNAISVAELGTILSIWAHPDDETFLAAGVMSTARDLGQRVVCVSATAGEHGTDDPTAWPPSRLGEVRRWEAAAAMAVLGVDEHHILGLPDGGLEGRDAEGLAWVGQLIDDVNPDTILTFGPEGVTYHPDHIAVHRWVTAAWSQRDRPCRLLYAASSAEHLDRFRDLYEEWNIYMTDERPTGVPEDRLALRLQLEGAVTRPQAHRSPGDGDTDQRRDGGHRTDDVRRRDRRGVLCRCPLCRGLPSTDFGISARRRRAMRPRCRGCRRRRSRGGGTARLEIRSSRTGRGCRAEPAGMGGRLRRCTRRRPTRGRW